MKTIQEQALATREILTDAEQHLRDLGLVCVGRSSKSASSYWGTDAVVGPKAPRLSDHDVACESSDWPVCVGVEGCQDFDLIIRNTEDWRAKLTTAARQASEAVEINEEEIREQAECDGENGDDAVASKKSWLRKHFAKLYVQERN